jgi:ribosome-associated protein
MVEITPSVRIDETELQFNFIRASGPGGQNVNKVASSVQLRFDVRKSPSLQPDVKHRLIRLAGKRMTEDGVLVIEARRYRTQERNRQDAIARLNHLVEKAIASPVKRVPTRPSFGAVKARLTGKKQRGELKRRRQVERNELE